jgi:hypothetical protein
MCHEELLKDSVKMKEHIDVITLDSFNLYKNIVQTTFLFASLFDEKHWSDYKDISAIAVD